MRLRPFIHLCPGYIWLLWLRAPSRQLLIDLHTKLEFDTLKTLEGISNDLIDELLKVVLRNMNLQPDEYLILSFYARVLYFFLA